MKKLAQHSSVTNEAYTPSAIVDLARYTLEHIDLDPAACELSQQVVQAATFFDDDGQWGGLGKDWGSVSHKSGTGPRAFRVFLNPPGGKLHKETLLPFKAGGKGNSATNCVSTAAVWWAKLYAEWSADRVDSAIYICFSMSIFRTSQDFADVPAVFEFPFCVPRERVNYDAAVWIEPDSPRPTRGTWERVPTKGAPADSAIILLPPKKELALAGPVMARFKSNFEPLGKVRF